MVFITDITSVYETALAKVKSLLMMHGLEAEVTSAVSLSSEHGLPSSRSRSLPLSYY